MIKPDLYRLLIGLFFFQIAMSTMACNSTKPVSRIEKIIINEDTTLGKYGVDSQKTILNYSLYIEYYKQDNYKDAYRFWRYLYKNSPRFNKGIYVNGAKIIKSFIKNEKDESIKKLWMDTLMDLYDQRIVFFDEKGYVLGKKGTDLFTLNPPAFEEAYKYLCQSIEIEGNHCNKTIPYYYIYTSTLMLKNNKLTSDELINNFTKANEVIDYNLNGAQGKAWETISQNVLNQVKNYLDCDKLIPAFSEAFKKNPDNLKMLLKFQSTMEAQKCTDNDLYLSMSEKVFTLEPNAKRANSLGIAYYSKDIFSKAIVYYKEAVKLEEDPVTKAKYYMSLADAYRKSGDLSSARASAINAATNNPADGTPNIFIGDMYAISVKTCGTSAFEQKAIYWIAVDQYIIARGKGNANASQRIAKYRQYFPTKEEAFYQDPPVRDGESYQINCWINASTTARFNE